MSFFTRFLSDKGDVAQGSSKLYQDRIQQYAAIDGERNNLLTVSESLLLGLSLLKSWTEASRGAGNASGELSRMLIQAS